ncbi:MAG TPA: DUF3551 domain-containing protein [Xanthobacteraceae bacterium]|nr:DUF3551 domain-containing protein [Xanthobacteraceae bacterium]
MKTSVSVFQALAVAGAIGLMAAATPARAQNYPWCARYGTPYDDTSCGFVSYEQCMASVSGIGGFCEKNDTFKPPLAVQHPQAHRHHAKNS